MKLKEKIKFFFLLAFLGLGLFPGLVYAQTASVSLPAGEVINRDYLTAGENITLSGTINGDVFVAGGTVTIDGVVNGDLLGAGGNVNLLGRVSEDVRVVGGNVLVNGSVGKNLTLAGGNLTLSSQARVIGNMVVFGGNFDVKAPVGGDLTVYADKALLGSEVGGDVTGVVEKLELLPEAVVAGDLVYSSPEPAVVADGAVVKGETDHKRLEEVPVKWRERSWRTPAAVFGTLKVYTKLVSLLTTFLLGWLFFRLFPKQGKVMLEAVKNDFWKTFLVGSISVFLLGPVIVLLGLSLFGIPLIFVLVPAFFFLAYLGKIFLAEALGEKVLGKRAEKGKWPWPLFVGLVIYYLLRLVPVVGMFVVFIFSVSGLGAIWLGLRKESKKTGMKK